MTAIYEEAGTQKKVLTGGDVPRYCAGRSINVNLLCHKLPVEASYCSVSEVPVL